VLPWVGLGSVENGFIRRAVLPRRLNRLNVGPARAHANIENSEYQRLNENTRKRKTMTKKFRQGWGHWERYRSDLGLTRSDEVDLHFGKRDPSRMTYKQAMAGVTALVVASLEQARRNGRPYLVFIHGSSTSRRGKTTARSQVRNFMRSKEATPLIDRSGCIQHGTVFIAKLKPDVGRA
jgi:hypothetical protein